MDDAFGMGCVECIGDLDAQGQNQLSLHRTPRDAVLQGRSIQELHRYEGLPTLLVNLVDGADVRVVQSRCGLRFPLETRQSLGILGYLIR